MAIPRANRYQYETSPRKLEPEYQIREKKYPKKSTAPKLQKRTNTVKQTKAEVKANKMKQIKLITIVVAVFVAVLTVSYRNSLIDESFSKSEQLKEDYLAIEKENDQMKVDIENSLNLNNVEQQAKELLGMQKLSPKQTVYVSLPKKDYIQPATESVVIDDSQNVFEKIVNKIKDIF